jgi:hypothetical protein
MEAAVVGGKLAAEVISHRRSAAPALKTTTVNVMK